MPELPSFERCQVVLPDHPGLPFSDAVTVGDMIYVAGRLGLDPATRQVPREVEEEVRYLMNSLRKAVEEAGALLDDVVMVTIFCSDLSLYDRFNALYKTYFTNGYPARAFIGSGPLLRGAHFELTAIAIRGSSRGH